MPTVHDDLFSGGRGLLYEVHGRAGVYYKADDGGATPTSITIPMYEQLGATDHIETYNLTIRASEIAAPVEGDWIIMGGETARRVIVNIKSHPNGDFVVRARTLIART